MRTKQERELEKSFKLSEEYIACSREISKHMLDDTPDGRTRCNTARKRMQQIEKIRERQWIRSTRRFYADRPDLLRAYERHLVRMEALGSRG